MENGLRYFFLCLCLLLIALPNIFLQSHLWCLKSQIGFHHDLGVFFSAKIQLLPIKEETNKKKKKINLMLRGWKKKIILMRDNLTVYILDRERESEFSFLFNMTSIAFTYVTDLIDWQMPSDFLELASHSVFVWSESQVKVERKIFLENYELCLDSFCQS